MSKRIIAWTVVVISLGATPAFATDLTRDSQDQTQRSDVGALQEQESEFTQNSIGPEDLRLPADQDHLADVFNNLGMTYHAVGKSAEAAEFFMRELVIHLSTAGGFDSPNVAQSLDNLAHLYIDQGWYREAAPIYRLALTIWERTLGPEHVFLAKEREHYADLLRKIELPTEPGQQRPT